MNCTVVSNYVAGTDNIRAGGIVFIGGEYDKVAVTNCIISGNWNKHVDGTSACAHNAAKSSNAKVILSHTLLDNWAEIDPDAEGCQTGDPLLVDSEGHDWRLGKRSPCRDAGVTFDFMKGGKDLDGRPRVSHKDLVDLGCYEADYIAPCTLLILR